jgi:diacylglycerol kinase (ATP)
MFSKFYFIVNPVAGGGKYLACLTDIQNFCKHKNLQHEIVLTKAPNHATELAKKAAQHHEVVVAVGGDGTVNEVSNGLIGTPAVLGIIPTGSGNDFSREVGYTKSIRKDLEKLLQGRVEYMDIGLVNGSSYFVNIFGVGFDGEVSYRAHSFKKYGHGLFAYLLTVLRTLATYSFHKVRITIDSHDPIEKEIFMVAIANGTTFGGGFNIAPAAKIDDGFFTVCIVDKTTKLYALRNLPRFLKGTHIGLPPVHMLTGKRIVIESKDVLQSQLDGELPLPASRFSIELVPNKLKVITTK